MSLQKKDFIEIEFTGRVTNGEVFDSNILEDLKTLHAGHDHDVEAKPLTICLGEGMFLNSLEDFLIGKEIGKEYTIDLEPEKAFGKRNPELVQMIPLKIFIEKNVNPVIGASLNFDGRIGKILTVSGGRVMVDFNHFLSGKNVTYKIKVLRKVEDINEKVKALNEFFFRRDFNFEIKEKKLIMDVDKAFMKFVEMFKEKFSEILGLEIELKEVPDKKPKE